MTEGVFATADRSYYSIDSILIAQSIAEAHQAVAEVDVLDHDFGVGHREVIVGEIPEAFDAHADQTAAQLLGSAAGHAENGYFRLVLGAEVFQLVHMQDLDAIDLLAHLFGGVVEGSDQLVAVGVGGDEAALPKRPQPMRMVGSRSPLPNSRCSKMLSRFSTE